MLKYKGMTSIGTVRENNEDTYIICENRLKDSLFLIADGMGGHSAGEVASGFTSKIIRDAFLELSEPVDYNEFLRDAIQSANDRVYKSSIINSKYKEMGTTVSVLIMSRDKIYIGHVGDSRIYYITDNTIQQLTSDHTVYEQMLEQYTAQEIASTLSSKQFKKVKNTLTHAIGTSKKVTISLIESQIPMRKNLQFLLCSDGLTDGVSDEAIHKILNRSKDLEFRLEELMEVALNSVSKDNITFIGIEKGGYENNGK